MSSRNLVFKHLPLSLLLAMFALFICFASAAKAQSALDGFEPNVTGNVYAVAVQTDGKILIGGDFTAVGGVTINRMARLNADGTLDTSFTPLFTRFGVTGDNVLHIVAQANGKILVGGTFTAVNGHPTFNTARLNADGSPDTTFSGVDTGGAVQDIEVQSDGKILIVP